MQTKNPRSMPQKWTPFYKKKKIAKKHWFLGGGPIWGRTPKTVLHLPPQYRVRKIESRYCFIMSEQQQQQPQQIAKAKAMSSPKKYASMCCWATCCLSLWLSSDSLSFIALSSYLATLTNYVVPPLNVLNSPFVPIVTLSICLTKQHQIIEIIVILTVVRCLICCSS